MGQCAFGSPKSKKYPDGKRRDRPTQNSPRTANRALFLDSPIRLTVETVRASASGQDLKSRRRAEHDRFPLGSGHRSIVRSVKELAGFNVRLWTSSVTTYYYHRRTRKRIKGDYGSPEFLASYAEAMQRDPGLPNNDLGNLVHLYRTSQAYANLARTTKRNYEPILADISDFWSDMPFACCQRPKHPRRHYRKTRSNRRTL